MASRLLEREFTPAPESTRATLIAEVANHDLVVLSLALLRVLQRPGLRPCRTAVLNCWERRVLCHTSTVLCSWAARSCRARLSCARRGDVRLCPAGSGHDTIGG